VVLAPSCGGVPARRRWRASPEFSSIRARIAAACVRQQLLERVGDERGIAEIGIAVDIGVAHRLDHQVDAARRMKAEIAQLVFLQRC